MLNPARPKSCTVASCSEPFGSPSFSVIGSDPLRGQALGTWRSASAESRVLRQFRKEACSPARVTDVAVAFASGLDEQCVLVAVDRKRNDLQPVAGGFALGPQRIARA